MRSRPAALVLVVVLAVASGCSKDEKSSEKAAKKGASSSSTASTDPSAPGEAPAAGEGPTTTLGGPLGSIKPPPAEPKGTAQLTLSRTISGTITADPQVRCVTGDGFFDIDLSFEPSTPLGADLGFVSLAVSAPNFKGPGRYDLKASGGAESVVVEELETGVDIEFFAPENGARGLVEIEAGAQKGRFEVRGLVDVDDRPLDVVGTFSCGQMAPM